MPKPENTTDNDTNNDDHKGSIKVEDIADKKDGKGLLISTES